MYSNYFGFTDTPFSIAPDPRYLYMSEQHREALAHLLYGIGDHGGFVLLTGEVGTGKTTVCRCLLQQMPDNTDVAYIINPKQNATQLLQSIFAELGLPYQATASCKDLVDQLNHYLLQAHARGRNTLLLIDEAQNLAVDVLEQLRLLTNLETNEKKLLQLILIGQPELNDKLARPELRQLSQRVTARYHLKALPKSELERYISHRMSVAGVRQPLFSRGAIHTIYRFSAGVPRLVNLICDRALLGVYAENGNQAANQHAKKAAVEVLGQHQPSLGANQWYWLSLLIVLVAVLLYSLHSGLLAGATGLL